MQLVAVIALIQGMSAPELKMTDQKIVYNKSAAEVDVTFYNPTQTRLAISRDCRLAEVAGLDHHGQILYLYTLDHRISDMGPIQPESILTIDPKKSKSMTLSLESANFYTGKTVLILHPVIGNGADGINEYIKSLKAKPLRDSITFPIHN